MIVELIWFVVGVYGVVKFFQYSDTQPKYPDPLDTPQDYM
jgi:hypothetical protein